MKTKFSFFFFKRRTKLTSHINHIFNPDSGSIHNPQPSSSSNPNLNPNINPRSSLFVQELGLSSLLPYNMWARIMMMLLCVVHEGFSHRQLSTGNLIQTDRSKSCKNQVEFIRHQLIHLFFCFQTDLRDFKMTLQTNFSTQSLRHHKYWQDEDDIMFDMMKSYQLIIIELLKTRMDETENWLLSFQGINVKINLESPFQCRNIDTYLGNHFSVRALQKLEIPSKVHFSVKTLQQNFGDHFTVKTLKKNRVTFWVIF